MTIPPLKCALMVFLFGVCVIAQTPTKEYIRLGGRVIAIENPGTPVGFSINGPVSVSMGTQATFTATSAANWTIVSGGGTLAPASGTTASVIYTAVASVTTPQSVTLKAISAADPTVFAQKTFVVTPTASLTISGPTTMAAGSQAVFTASQPANWAITTGGGTLSTLNGSATTTFTAPSTSQTVVIQATAAANPSQTQTISIDVTAVTLSLGSVVPIGTSGKVQTFTFSATHSSSITGPNTYVYFLVADSATAAVGNTCHIRYQPSTNSLSAERLYEDNWTTPVPVTGPTTVGGERCSVNTSTSSTSFSADGKTVTITLANVTFYDGFDGTHRVYTRLTDGVRDTDYVDKGAWTVPYANGVPVSTANSSTYSGTTITAGGTLIDPNGQNDIRITEFSVFADGAMSYRPCILRYDRNLQQFSFYNDVSGTWQTFAYPQSQAFENSFCKLENFVYQLLPTPTLVNFNIKATGKNPLLGAGRIMQVKLQDQGGLIGGDQYNFGSWDSPGNVPPNVISFSPASGSGSSQIFTGVYRDTNGYLGVKEVQALVNATNSSVNACLLSYSRISGAFRLRDNNNLMWMDLGTGANASVSNSQCTLSRNGTSVVSNGTDLTVNWNVSFNATFSGAKTVYHSVTDLGNLVSSVFSSYWSILPNQAPVVVVPSPLPALSGTSGTVQVTLGDANGTADVKTATVAIGPDATSFCYFRYEAGPQQLYLYDQRIAGWLGPLSAGGSAYLENEFCTVGLPTVNVGASLALSFPVTAKPTFANTWHRIFARVVDQSNVVNAGGYDNFVQVGEWNVPGNLPPVLKSFTATPGAGNTYTFQAVYDDPNGNVSLWNIRYLINSTDSNVNACLIFLSNQFAAPGYFWLRNNADTSWDDPLPTTAGASISNGQCRLYRDGTNIVRSGNTLTVNIKVGYLGAFAGVAKTMWQEFLDLGWLSTGRHTWKEGVNQAPVVVVSSPSLALTGTSNTVQVALGDANGTTDLKTVTMAIGPSATSFCYFRYEAGPQQLYLYDQRIAGWLGPLSAGGASYLENEFCTVGLPTVYIEGNMWLSFPVTAKTALASQYHGIYARVVDQSNVPNAGGEDNFVQIGSWNVPGNLPPVLKSFTATPGPGNTYTFQAVYDDPNGNVSLWNIRYLINTANNNVNGCLIFHSNQFPAPAGHFRLRNDTDTSWDTLPDATGTSKSNSQCTLYRDGTNIVRSGNTLTVNIKVSYTSAFAGVTKTMWQEFVDLGWLSTGKLTWTEGVNQAPIVVVPSPLPALTGASNTVQVTVGDGNGTTDLKTVTVAIGPDATSFCQFRYEAGPRQLYLFDETVPGWIGPLSAGGAAYLENAYCTVGLPTVTAATNLALSFPVTTKPTFTSDYHVIFAKVVDQSNVPNAGGYLNFVKIGDWNVPGNQPPVLTSITPVSGSGNTYILQAVYNDPNGNMNLWNARYLINSTDSNVNACLIFHSNQAPAPGVFWLRNNTDTDWEYLGNGATDIKENSQCTIHRNGTSIVRSGNTLTVNIKLTFKSSFVGNKTIWQEYRDLGWAWTGRTTTTWTVTN